MKGRSSHRTPAQKKVQKGGRTVEDSAKERRGLDRHIVVWGLIFVASFVIVIVGNLLLGSWFGIGVGCLVGIAGLLWVVNSSRYVRDAWELEQEMEEALDKQSRNQLARRISRKRDYRGVDVNHAIICLSASAGLFALTMLLKMMYG